MTIWIVEKSYKVEMPSQIEARTYRELRDRLQAFANDYIPSQDAPALGPLIFRDDRDKHPGMVSNTIWAFFTNKHGKRARFARLRRAP